MREISKKAQSEIIVTILLILLVLVAIFIIYSVIMSVIRGGAEDIDSEIMSVQLEIVKDSVYIDYSDEKLQLSVSRGSDKANVSSIKIVVLGKDEGGNDMTYIETRTIEIPQPLEYRIYVLDITEFKEDSITKISVYPVSLKGKVGIGYTYTVKTTEQGTSPGGGPGDGEWYTGDSQTGNKGPGSGPGEETPSCTTNGCSAEGARECTTTYKYHTCVNTGSCLEWVSGNCNEELCINGECVPQVRTYFKDSDGDHWSDGTSIDIAIPPEGYYLPTHFSVGGQSGDCNDNNFDVHPGVTETCGDNIDFNCNGYLSDGCCKQVVAVNVSGVTCSIYNFQSDCLNQGKCVDMGGISQCSVNGNLIYSKSDCALYPSSCFWKLYCSWG